MNYPIIDCHCHIYPDKIAQRAVKGIADFYDISMCYDGRYSTLLESGEKIGVKHYIIFSVATTPHQVHSINTFISQTVKSSDGIMSGLGTLHPDSENIEQDIDEIIFSGLKGVKLHPDFQKFKVDDPECDKIYELCAGRMPVLLHTGDTRYDFSSPERVERVLKRHKDLTVIGAHFGGWSCWKEAAERLYKYENFFVDSCSTSNWLSEKEVKALIGLYGCDRVLFGTDFPMWSHEKEYKFIKKLSLTESEESKIFYENAKRIFEI